MTRMTKAQQEESLLAEAMADFRRIMDEAPVKKAVENRYYATVRECNFSDCMHFDASTRHCSLKICAYDLKEDDPKFDDDDWDEWEDGGLEWVE